MTPAPYRRPFWWMLALFIITGLYYSYNLSLFYSSPYIQKSALKSITLQFVIIVGAVLIETIIYWIIRKRIHDRLWANLHVLFLYLALVGVPITFFLFRMYADRSTMSRISTAQALFFWLSLLAAHVFFIATIVKSFSRPQPEQQHAHNTANILDEFTR